MPIERYGNEEDPYSREYRRTYAEENLPSRLHDDRPYDRAGYEPESGRPGSRENVDLERTRYRDNRPDNGSNRVNPGYGQDWGQRDPEAMRARGQYPGRYPGHPKQRGTDSFGEQRTSSRERDPYGQSAYRQLASPYNDDDATEPWYGGDTGMGDPGSSQFGPQEGTRSQSGGRHASSRGGSQGQWGSYRQDDLFSDPSGRSSSQYDDRQRGGYASGQQTWQSGGQRDWQQDQRDPLHGPFSGRGPRNYQRSDERIRDDVCELLTRHGGIDASQMEVDVRQGVVTLRGMADSGRMRRMAEELVEDIAGVRDVQNDLRVAQRTGYGEMPAGMAGSGALGATQGAGAASQQATTPAYGTGVASTSGVSTRSGPGEPGASAGAGRSQHGNAWQVRETMDVVGSDGESVGTVKTVAGTDFILDRPMARDLHVPFSAVQTVDGERVMLRCRANEVDQQGWPTSDLTGSSTTTGTGDRPGKR
jgi:hypothetical protein